MEDLGRSRRASSTRLAEAPGRLDFGDAAFQSRPWPLYEWYRQHDPVHWSPQAATFFAFGYGHVRHVLVSTEFGAHHPFRKSSRAFGVTVLDKDGEPHRTLRSRIAPPFRRPRSADFVDDAIVPLAKEMVRELVAEGHEDGVQRLAERLPMRIVCRLLGIADSHVEWLREKLRPLVLYVDHAPVSLEAVIQHRRELASFLVGERELTSPDGLLESLLGDKELSEAEAVSNLVLVLAAGTETTTAALGNLMLRLATEEGLLSTLKADPHTVPAAVAESLRLDPPLHWTLRFAHRDTKLGGVEIPGGAPVQVCVASANRDPEVFERPESWSLDRVQRPVPLTFGAGRHACLGMALARAELEAVACELAWTSQRLELPDSASAEISGRTFRTVPQLRLRVVPEPARL